MKRINILSKALIAMLFVVLAACGDDTVNSNTDLDGNRDPGSGPSLSDQYFMVPATGVNIQANITESVPVKVFLYSKKTGDPVAQQKIGYEIIDTSLDQASFSAKNSTTTDDGSASVDLRVGGVSGTITVRADHPSANAVDFVVEVLPLEVGTLKANIVHSAPGILDLYEIDVRIYEASQMTCDEFRPFFEQQEPMRIQQAPRPETSLEFEELGTRPTFIATAIARGDRGQIAAAACEDGIQIQKDQVTERDILLQLIPLSPVGTYDVTSNWDFTEAVASSGAVGSTIVRILNVFENPGQAIFDEVINLVELYVGSIVSGLIDIIANATGIATLIEDTINDAIEGNAVLSKIFRVGSDLREVIANLEVHSELVIGKLSSTYEFRGTDNWLGIRLFWRWDCDANSAPDCGAIDIIADANGQLGELGVLSSEWSGRVVAYNQLQIDTHPLTLRYGKLIVYLLNEVIIPELTDNNAHSLTEAFAYWIGCDSLATSITGSDGEICVLGACLQATQIEGFCSSSVNTLFGFASLMVENLDYDIGLRLGGEATLVEIDSDGFADLIEEGTFTGFIENSEGGMATSPFTSTWSGVRRDFDTNNL